LRVIVQIYGVMSPDDGAMVAERGADQIGVAVGERGTVWDAVDFEAANGIFSAIKTGATKVALSLSGQTSEIETVIRAVRFDLLHLAAGADGIRADQVAELKRRHPGLGVIRTIPVIGHEAAFAATAFEDVAD
jgi:phosphoribosylanthranilate isomerase